MNITFDAQLLLKGEKTGIAWCAENILHRMPQYGQKLNLNCFTMGYSDDNLAQVDKYRKLGYEINRCSWFHDVIYRMIWNIIPVPYSLFFRKQTDCMIFFNYVLPPGTKGKKVIFVYDMSYKSCPETVRSRTRNLLNIALEKSCRRADKIITISEFSKQEIIRYLGIDEKKIVIMPCGVDFSVYHTDYSEEKVKTATAKYNISSDYLLYLGTLEPRKNITRLIHAYARLTHKVPNLPKLVLAGRKGWLYESIFDTVKELRLEENVIFTGYVEEKDAPLLMKGAKAFLFPSVYEGFGMPPLEAMACGTPVLTSNVSSLPEVVGDAGILTDPYSVESISEGIYKLLNNEGLREELIAKGLERVKKFTWDNSAEIVYQVLQDLNQNREA